jgi:hypothetical protein
MLDRSRPVVGALAYGYDLHGVALILHLFNRTA